MSEDGILRKGLRKFTSTTQPMDEMALDSQGNPSPTIDAMEAKSILREARSIRDRTIKNLDWQIANDSITYTQYVFKKAELEKEYESVIRQIMHDMAPHDQGGKTSGEWSGDQGTSGGTQTETQLSGIISAHDTSRTTGWRDQNNPSGSYRTEDRVPNQGNISTLPRGSKPTSGAANRGSAQSGIYPDGTRITTFETGKGEHSGRVSRLDDETDSMGGTYTPTKGKWSPSDSDEDTDIGDVYNPSGAKTQTEKHYTLVESTQMVKEVSDLPALIAKMLVTGNQETNPSSTGQDFIDQLVKRRDNELTGRDFEMSQIPDNIDPRARATVATSRKRRSN